MKKIVINNINYELINDYREAFNQEELEEKWTDYFEAYTYVVGDYAYNKLRLKGFYDDNNPNVKKLNNIKYLDDYIKNNCAYGCKWFEIKKID